MFVVCIQCLIYFRVEADKKLFGQNCIPVISLRSGKILYCYTCNYELCMNLQCMSFNNSYIAQDEFEDVKLMHICCCRNKVHSPENTWR